MNSEHVEWQPTIDPLLQPTDDRTEYIVLQTHSPDGAAFDARDATRLLAVLASSFCTLHAFVICETVESREDEDDIYFMT